MATQEKIQRIANMESDLFSEVCEMMYHSKVENGRRFLCMMNNVVEYCSAQQSSDDGIVNYHIIYVPTCPDWARELLVRFLVHKYALTTSDDFISIAKQKTSNIIQLPEKTTKKYLSELREERIYYRKYLKLFENKNLPDNDHKKSLFVVQEKDITTRKQDKNPWFDQLYTASLYDTKRKVLVTTSESALDIESKIRKSADYIPTIENIFVFHSPNRGRLSNSYNKQQLERLNRYGVGIKNCFVFYISDRPFRLYQAQEGIKYNLASNLLNREVRKYDDFAGFITFTPDEIDYLFDRDCNNYKLIIDSPEREVFTSDIDSYFDELAHNYKMKIALSLAITPRTQELFIEECKQFTGVSCLEIIEPFLNYYQHAWDEDISIKILEAIDKYYTVAFVLPRWVDKEYQHAIISCFQDKWRRILIVNTEDLKEGINADAIVLFTFRYTDNKYKSYPNSFDPLPLKPGQIGITVINRLTHNRYYEWNKHFYDKAYNAFYYSDFRQEILGWSKRVFQRPVLPDIFENIEEAEADAREYMAEKCIVQFESGKIKPLAASRVLYHDGVNYRIASLKDLPFEEGMEIQMLDDIVVQIKESLIKKTTNSLKAEEYIRKDPSYGLTQEQIYSKIELWKFLLKRKVEETSVKEAYETIFQSSKEISIRGFERWLDFDYPMILPRSRRSQNNLLTYLGFKLGGAYHRVILTKKLMRNSNTRMLNSQIESLLQSILTVRKIHKSDFEKLFDENSEILTLLEVKNASDVNTLVELLDINLKKVISIKYDSNKA